jgi:hypothetical protein
MAFTARLPIENRPEPFLNPFHFVEHFSVLIMDSLFNQSIGFIVITGWGFGSGVGNRRGARTSSISPPSSLALNSSRQ